MELAMKVGRMSGVFGTDSLQELEKLLKELPSYGDISENINIPMILRSGFPTHKTLALVKN
jgi:hypothetical protein